jgi:HD-like signal output (HDOD) protein
MFEMRSLEPFPGVAARVLEVAGRTEVVPSELIELVQTDPGITSKVLKLCNSAYYGFQREIASLHEAGNLLGVTTLVNLVLTSSAGKYFRDYGSAKNRSMEARWEQCVSNAIGARLIAKRHGKVDPDRAYTAGLLENIGHLVLDRFLDEAIEEIRGLGSTTPRSGLASRPAGPFPTCWSRSSATTTIPSSPVRTRRSPPRSTSPRS